MKHINKNVEDITKSYSGRSIAKNTIYNFLGYSIPLAIALILIPPLIKGLGTERFGILSLAWMIIGNFSFFDFGIGKGLTKIISEKIGSDQTNQMPKIFWTSLSFMLIVSLSVSLVLLLFAPALVNLFKISKNMRQETLYTFYILIASIPIVSTTAGLRGVLEAYQKFIAVNIMRTLLGVLTFLVPLLILIFTNSLFWIVVSLIIIRVLIWMLYLFQCFRVNNDIRREIKFDFNSIRPVLRFSVWITVANIVGPLILYSDRFMIGALISAAAITYYATPYEIVTKILLIPGALTGVLFPVFSASFISNPDVAKKILLRGIKFIFLIIYPLIFLIITFSYEGMHLWLGKEFAVHSSLILQFLSIGILMNGLAAIPNNFFQGIGKPKIPTLINSIELPFYLFVMWLSIKTNGVKGAAIAYMVMAIIDSTIMYIVAYKKLDLRFKTKLSAIMFVLMMLTIVIPFFLSVVLLKIFFAAVILTIFILFSWKYFLSNEEKYFISSKLKIV